MALIGRLEEKISSLAVHPGRGSRVVELEALGVNEYREVVLKPYRMIYLPGKVAVVVLVVADGKRDMKTLLQRRLLEA